MKKIKITALLLLAVTALDHMSYVFFSFPSLYHYAMIHSAFEKWYVFTNACCAMIALLYLDKD